MEDLLETKKPSVLAWISRDDERIEEIRELCDSAGYDIVAEVRQNRNRADPRSYIGPGKLEELKEIDCIEYLVTPSDLDPSQVFRMGKVTGLKVVDRIRVVLDLFKYRATSPEARLQVELADLKYQLPILKEYIHQGTLSDRPGFLAGGEYRVDYYYQMAGKRMAHIKEQLRLQRKRRGMTRALRKRRGLHLVAVAGYTNAGKSTLMNSISDTEIAQKFVDTENRMFTTIATSTRKMKGSRDCIVTDTVGFIRDLPPWLVEGFMSTLEEVFEADVVLLLMDVSDTRENAIRKVSDSLEILRKGNCRGKIILVMNKIDLIVDTDSFDPEIDLDPDTGSMIDGYSRISARTGEGIEKLMDLIDEVLPALVKVIIRIPHEGSSREILGLIRKVSSGLNIEYENDGTIITSSLEERWAGSIEKALKPLGGKLERISRIHE
jgi:GTP-binding protein HflX